MRKNVTFLGSKWVQTVFLDLKSSSLKPNFVFFAVSSMSTYLQEDTDRAWLPIMHYCWLDSVLHAVSGPAPGRGASTTHPVMHPLSLDSRQPASSQYVRRYLTASELPVTSWAWHGTQDSLAALGSVVILGALSMLIWATSLFLPPPEVHLVNIRRYALTHPYGWKECEKCLKWAIFSSEETLRHKPTHLYSILVYCLSHVHLYLPLLSSSSSSSSSIAICSRMSRGTLECFLTHIPSCSSLRHTCI